jgi:hypothetical protein
LATDKSGAVVRGDDAALLRGNEANPLPNPRRS